MKKFSSNITEQLIIQVNFTRVFFGNTQFHLICYKLAKVILVLICHGRCALFPLSSEAKIKPLHIIHETYTASALDIWCSRMKILFPVAEAWEIRHQAEIAGNLRTQLRYVGFRAISILLLCQSADRTGWNLFPSL
jgi:hypothetical protein